METYGFATPAPGYRLPPTLRLGPVRLEINDLAASLEYYEKVLGLRVIRRDGPSVQLGPYGEDRTVVELTERAGAEPAPYTGRLGLYHFAILLPTRAALARFVTHLGELGAHAGMSDHGVSEAFYLRDPDGLGIEVYADRPRSEWPVRRGALGMVNAPIQTPDLIAAGGGKPWTGMPEGTVIGHVHLHVGALDEASRFFHAALGLDEVARMPGALFLSAGGYHHHLGTNIWAGNAARPKPGDARLLEWTMMLPPDDAEAAARSVETAGYSVGRDGSDWVLTDPWDTRFRLTAAA
jgi:catechol 2,3-dioxygenase